MKGPKMSIYLVFDRSTDGGLKNITVFDNRAAADFVKEHYGRAGVQEFSVYSRDFAQVHLTDSEK